MTLKLESTASTGITYPAQHANKRQPGPTVRILLLTASGSLFLRLQSALATTNYSITLERDIDTARRLIVFGEFELLLLDFESSATTGMDLCTGIRLLSPIPILLLTPSSRPEDVVQALQSGADHVVYRGASLQEIAAHISALVRRIYVFGQSDYIQPLSHGDIVLDCVLRIAKIGGRVSTLTDTECRLMAQLLAYPNQPVEKEALLAEIWGHATGSTTNVVELTIARLRKKIELDPSNPYRLITIRGIGYQLQTTIPLRVLESTAADVSATSARRTEALLPFRLRILPDA